MEYRTERKARKKAYTRLKQIARLQGKNPPENPYPCPIKEIQAEEKKYIDERFYDPEVRKILEKIKAEKMLRCRKRGVGMGVVMAGKTCLRVLEDGHAFSCEDL